MRCLRPLGIGALLLAFAVPVDAATVTIAWDPNPEPDVTGYTVFVGRFPGVYEGSQGVGNRTNWTFTGLADNTQYYFAVQAQTATMASPRSEIAFRTASFIPPGSEQSRSDFNGDGFFDLLWHHSTSGQTYAWHMNGNIAVLTRPLTPSSVPDVNWKIAGSGDFNHDGKPDVLWHNQANGNLACWLMDGAFQYQVAYPSISRVPDVGWRVAAIRDMNLDGNPDWLWHHQGSGDVAIWYLNGLQVLQTGYMNPPRVADTTWKLRAAADFTGDGKPDLFWESETTGDLFIWVMDGMNMLWTEPVSPTRVADTRWDVVAVGDANRDGWPDLIWQHRTTGELYLWTMYSKFMQSTPFIGTVADINWKVVGPR